MAQGFLWRKYISPYSLDDGDGSLTLLRREVGNTYPDLTRWGQLEDAVIGLVYTGSDGPPLAVCYDMQKAIALFADTLGTTGALVVDAMDLEESFRSMLLSAFMGADTPFFWSDSNNWRNELYCFVHKP